MPRIEIKRATNFIVEDESWTIVDYDHTSVPGVVYFSLTEGKVNSLVDDLENNIADTHKIAKYELSLPDVEQIFKLGDHIIPTFTLMKNGELCNEEIEYVSEDKTIIRIIDGIPIAVGNGQTNLIIQLKNNPEIQKMVSITVGAEEQEFSAYIDGNDFIKLNRNGTFTLRGISEISSTVSFTINDVTLAAIIEIDNNQCVIHANAENKLGTFILTATYLGVSYTKEIKVIPLW